MRWRPQLRYLVVVGCVSTVGLLLLTAQHQRNAIDQHKPQQHSIQQHAPVYYNSDGDSHKHKHKPVQRGKQTQDDGPVEKQKQLSPIVAPPGIGDAAAAHDQQKYTVQVGDSLNLPVLTNANTVTPSRSSPCQTKYPDHGNVAIFIAVAGNSLQNLYRVAHTYLWCYAEVQQYRVFVVDIYADPLTFANCKMQNIFFRKHCAVASWMAKHKDEFQWFAVLDADTTPVNQAPCLQQYMDNAVDIVFYERFYNFEIAAGNYMAKNTEWTRRFLMDWAEFEFSTDGMNFSAFDNGALQLHLLKTLQPQATTEHAMCDLIWRAAFDYGSYLRYVTCVRYALGARKNWEHVKLYRRAHAWVMDWQITAGLWCEHSFMLHSWKTNDIPVDGNTERKWGTPFQRMPNTNECISIAANNGSLPSWPHRPEFKVPCDKIRHMLKEGEVSYSRDLPASAKAMPYLDFPEISPCWPDCQ